MGFSEVYALRGGYREWEKADFPLEPKKAVQQNCLTCHEEVTPRVVRGWKSSRHGESANDVSCSICHGTDHINATDVEQAKIPGAKRCRFCHEKDWRSFQEGQHAQAWQSKEKLPEYHYSKEEISKSETESCAQCHKIGLKPQQTTTRLWREQGIRGANSCANCHTAHAFSREQANRAQACQPCHSGTQTPQWEAYTASRHWEAQASGESSQKRQGPTCQTCHLSDGSHSVETPGGSTGLRFPLPQNDEEWSQARTDILAALGVLDPQNGTKQSLTTYQNNRFLSDKRKARQKMRLAMLRTCSQCHEQGFAEGKLRKADRVVRESDILLAQGIAILEGLYKDGHLEPPASTPFPRLMDASHKMAQAEKILRKMFYFHRKQAKSWSFHAPASKRASKEIGRLKNSLDQLRQIRAALQSKE